MCIDPCLLLRLSKASMSVRCISTLFLFFARTFCRKLRLHFTQNCTRLLAQVTIRTIAVFSRVIGVNRSSVPNPKNSMLKRINKALYATSLFCSSRLPNRSTGVVYLSDQPLYSLNPGGSRNASRMRNPLRHGQDNS